MEIFAQGHVLGLRIAELRNGLRHDRVAALHLPHDLRTGQARRRGHDFESFVALGRHEPEERFAILRVNVDARPVGDSAGGSDQPRIPGGRPMGKKLVGLAVVEPGGKVVERVAGQEDDDAFGRHSGECN